MEDIGEGVVPDDGLLWRTGRCAWDEGVSSQDAALVFQGVLPGAVGRADCPAGGWCVPADAMRGSTDSALNEVNARI